MQFLLAANNLTSVEDRYDRSKMSNPYDRGSWIANISQIFGEPGLDWILPTQPWSPESDGTIFFGPHDSASEWDDADDIEDLWTAHYHVVKVDSSCMSTPIVTPTS